jgi:hypothetical protein
MELGKTCRENYFFNDWILGWIFKPASQTSFRENPGEIFSRKVSSQHYYDYYDYYCLLLRGRATVDTRKTAFLAFLASLKSSNSLRLDLATE